MSSAPTIYEFKDNITSAGARIDERRSHKNTPARPPSSVHRSRAELVESAGSGSARDQRRSGSAWIPLSVSNGARLSTVLPTLEEAEAAVSAYAQQGHQNPANADLHLTLNKRARPSDYAALFHLQRLLPNIRSIFDLGGNVGNLYYCYSDFFPDKDLAWTVHDLPENIARGRRLAHARGADRLSFADTWREASGADLLLISGALHYLKQPLASMLSTLKDVPRYILINRTPVTDGPSFAAVQDSGPFRVACLVRNRQELLKELEGAGYRLLDTWYAAELTLRIPGDADHTVPFYSGFLLEHDPVSVATQSGQEIRAEG